MSYRNKTLSLQRAYFNEGFNGNLEAVLRNAFLKLPKAKDRIIEIDLISRQLFADFEDARTGDGIFIRVLEFEQGAIGVINLDTTDSSAAVEEFLHPKNQDFLRDEAVLFIIGNNVVACNIKNKHGTLAASVLELAQRADVLSDEVKMKVADVPDQTTLTRLKEVGVKEVDFSVTSYMANLDFPVPKGTRRNVVKMIFGVPTDENQTRKRANAIGRLVLKRGRFEKDEIDKDAWLTEIGAEVMESGSSEKFRIKLEDESIVSNSSLKKSKTVKLKRYANSFSYESAKLELERYYRDLKSDGSLGA